MKVVHDMLEVVVAIGVMAMFLAVISTIDISSARNDPDPVVAKQDTVYVNASYGGMAQNGSYKHPYSTIQEGINAAVSGQTVLVEPGVYYGNLELKSGVVLKSRAGPSYTIIDGQGASIAVMSPYGEAPESRIDGFTVRNAISLLDIRNRVDLWSHAHMDVNDCVFYGASRGVNVTAGASADITRSVFTDLDEAMADLWTFHVVVKNVTIDKVGHAFVLRDSAFKVYNTSISRSGCVAMLRGGNTVYVVEGSNNNVCSCTAMTEPSGEGIDPLICFDAMYEEQPMFVDADGMDYHQLMGSPLIDLGVDVGLPYYGSAPDIGAYEYVPTGVTLEAEYDSITYPINYVLPESRSSITVQPYHDEGEKKRDAIETAVIEVMDELEGMDQSMPVQGQINALVALRDRLVRDVRSRADGYYGGSTADDWITSMEGQYNVVSRVDDLIMRLDDKINALFALTQ